MDIPMHEICVAFMLLDYRRGSCGEATPASHTWFLWLGRPKVSMRKIYELQLVVARGEVWSYELRHSTMLIMSKIECLHLMLLGHFPRAFDCSFKFANEHSKTLRT